uniref:Ribonuclease P protein subunit p29 n=1 Tax=Glossina morsitans morsitans TaxID=37546 RepID=A0A1B0FJI5_GLOMM
MLSMDLQVENLKEFLIDVVDPKRRSEVEINPDHITLLHGAKSKKQLSHKKRRSKNSALTRREYAQLGLNTLPTRQIKFKEALPLHHLWKGYMKEHLGLSTGDTVPQVFDPRYDAFSKLIVKTDLHGAKIRVIQSKCPTLVGLAGIVLLDTKNVLKIVGEDDRLRTVPKSVCVFAISFANMELTIFGKYLTTRPAERSVKKIRKVMEPFE